MAAPALPYAAPNWGNAPLPRSGWDAPTGAAPWGYAPQQPPTDPTVEGRLLSGRALTIVIVAIAFGGVMQLIVYLLVRSARYSPDTLIQLAIVATLIVYALVGALLLSQITPKVRLRWGEGSLAVRIAFGLGIGGGLSGLLLWAISSARGQLSPDPNVVLMMSTGDASHVIVVTALTCVAAPVIEETLFRGLLLESLRHYSTGMALVVSAMFFAVWHFNPRGLVYYTILGAVLGGIYIKRGLLASMAAHLGFNGVLTVAAISLVLGPAHHYDLHGLRFTIAGRWTQVTSSSSAALVDSNSLGLQGPDGAAILIFTHLDDGTVDLTRVAQNFADEANTELDGPTAVPVTIELPTVGQAITTTISAGSHRDEFVVFRYNGEDFAVVFDDNSARAADGDLTKMLDSLQPSPSGT